MMKSPQLDVKRSEKEMLKDAPPAYDDSPPDIRAAFANLNLSQAGPVPTPDQCVAHLKFLEALNQLREDIVTTDGLYGLWNSFVPNTATEQEQSQLSAKIREKRWQIYVTRATIRFEAFWQSATQPNVTMLTQSYVSSAAFANIHKLGKPLQFTTENLPPLGTFFLNRPVVRIVVDLNNRCPHGVALVYAQSQELFRRLHSSRKNGLLGHWIPLGRGLCCH